MRISYHCSCDDNDEEDHEYDGRLNLKGGITGASGTCTVCGTDALIRYFKLGFPQAWFDSLENEE